MNFKAKMTILKAISSNGVCSLLRKPNNPSLKYFFHCGHLKASRGFSDP